MKIIIPTVDQVIVLNKYLCEEQGNPFQVLEMGKVASALHTAFYPGSYPFSAGGVAKSFTTKYSLLQGDYYDVAAKYEFKKYIDSPVNGDKIDNYFGLDLNLEFGL